MGLKDMLIRLRNTLGRSTAGTPISPDEKELECYLERERKAKIRKIVHQYRIKEEREFLQGRNVLNEPHTFKNYDFTRGKKKTKNLLNQGSIFR